MRFILALLVLALILGARAGVDFTPIAGERVLEGIVFKQILFHHDGHGISYEQPRVSTVTGNTSALTLTPPDVSQARVMMEQSRLTAPARTTS
ncbi:MAG: hypothetical protein ABI540_07575 [Spartobacteria bacterium]